MNNLNLNQLDNNELDAYKKAMDIEFFAKQLKPGDEGYEYNKVVDFKNQRNEDQLEDDSWDDDYDN